MSYSNILRAVFWINAIGFLVNCIVAQWIWALMGLIGLIGSYMTIQSVEEIEDEL